MDEDCEVLMNLRQATVEQLNNSCLNKHLKASKKWRINDLKKLVHDNWEMDEVYCYYESWMTDERYEICASCKNIINQFKEQYQELCKTDLECTNDELLDRISSLEDDVVQLKSQLEELKRSIMRMERS